MKGHARAHRDSNYTKGLLKMHLHNDIHLQNLAQLFSLFLDIKTKLCYDYCFSSKDKNRVGIQSTNTFKVPNY